MTEKKSKVQQAIDYLVSHRSARNQELASLMRCEPKAVHAMLQDPIKYGLIITCKIERPGERSTYEFRLSAIAPEGKAIDWRSWRGHQAKAAAKPATKKLVESVTQARSGEIALAAAHRSTSLATKQGEGAAVVEPPKQDMLPAEVRSDVTQPAPTPNTQPAVWSIVINDMKARDQLGRQRYGTPLQPHNGRDMLRDAYEEALDLAVYLRSAIYERDSA